MKKIITSRVLLFGSGLAAVFLVALWALGIANLILLENSLFIGTSVTLAIAYWRLFLDAIVDPNPFNRARWMTWAFFIAYLALLCGASGSIQAMATDEPTTTTFTIAVGRYLAIVAGIGQVTAPDFGRGIFFGIDRKVLTGAILLGIVVSVVLIWVQGTAAMAMSF